MKETAFEAYQKAVIENFTFAKNAKTIQEAYLRAIPIEGDGYLLPLCKVHIHDEELLNKLAEWRNTNVEAYPTQFKATLDSTRAWIKDRLVAVSDRMLYLVVNNTGGEAGGVADHTCWRAQRRPVAFNRYCTGDRHAVEQKAALFGSSNSQPPAMGQALKNQQRDQVFDVNEVVTIEDHLLDGGFGSWLLESVANEG